MKHGEFMISGADAAATPTNRLKYASALLSTSANVIMAKSQDGITVSETTNVLVIDTKLKSSGNGTVSIPTDATEESLRVGTVSAPTNATEESVRVGTVSMPTNATEE